MPPLDWTYAAIMAAASDPFVCFAGDTEGRFVVPGFMAAFDATAMTRRHAFTHSRRAKHDN